MDLYTPVHPRLCRYVQSLVWQQEEAKDLIGEITLKAFEQFDSIKNKEQFVFFLFGIARNLFLKKLRRQKFKAHWNEAEMNQIEGASTADERIQKKELAYFLSQLDPIQREAIMLYEVAGFSYEEISAILNLSLSNVKATLYKGRQALKELVMREQLRLNKVQISRGEPKLKMDGLL